MADVSRSASWPWWQVERDRFGVMFSGPLEVGEMIEVVSAEKCRGDIQRIHDMDDYIERLEAAAREVRAAFDAGEWPLGPSYKAVQDALRKLDDVMGES